MHGVEREDEADSADDTGRHHAGVGEFGVQAENAEDEEDKENIGLDDAREKFLPSGELEGHVHGIGERKLDLGAVEASDLTAIELAEEIVFGISDEIDELAV